MIRDQFLLGIDREMIVDLFAGGGGASTGIEMALGRHVDVAVNHDPEAVLLHQANHPQTAHFVSDVFEVDPREVTHGRPVGLLWASPDCTYHSKARGGKPHRDRNRARRRRGLAGVVVRWARSVRPRVICLENVEEFQDWGPLLDDGTPCPERRGSSFRRWVAQLTGAGYAVEWRELRAYHYGTPTTRKRLYLVARCDGQPICWPDPTHDDPSSALVRSRILRPWRTAAECIDWSIPCPSIFDRKRPLAENTLRRIAAGVRRYVLDAADPYVVVGAAPTLVTVGYGERPGQAPRVPGLDKPLGTVVASGARHALVAAFLAKHFTGVVGQEMARPIGTITTIDHHSLVTAHTDGRHAEAVCALLLKYYGTDGDCSISEPLHTITTRDRFGLVAIRGAMHEIEDIGMRMLQPRELYRAQGFPESYVIDRGADGSAITKTAQVRMCGNSVCPPVAAAIVRANAGDLAAWSARELRTVAA